MEGRQIWGDAPHNRGGVHGGEHEPSQSTHFILVSMQFCGAGQPSHSVCLTHTPCLKTFRPCVAVFLWIKVQGAKTLNLRGADMHECHVWA